MPLTEDDVARIASLARISISEGERAVLKQKISSTLDWIAQLNEVDVDNVQPLANPHDAVMTPDIHDLVTMGGDVEAVLSNAPDRLADFFKVPKVVE